MRSMRKGVLAVLVMLVIFSAVGCNVEVVEQGQIGRERTGSGWGTKVFGPGRHFIGYWSKMVRADATEEVYPETLAVLTADKINLKFQLEVRVGIDRSDEKKLLSLFDRVMVSPQEKMITRQDLYSRYGRPEAVSAAKNVLRPRKIDEILGEGEKIEKEIFAKFTEQLKGSPLKVYSARITNYDWPDVIEKAMEARKEREIEIESEKSKIERALVEAEGRRRVAEEEYKVQMLQAKMHADYNEVVANSLKGSPEYLQWRKIEMMQQFASGPNNDIILVPYEALHRPEVAVDLVQTSVLKELRKNGTMKRKAGDEDKTEAAPAKPSLKKSDRSAP